MYGTYKYLHEEYEFIFSLCKLSYKQNGDTVLHDLSKDNIKSTQKTALSIRNLLMNTKTVHKKKKTAGNHK